MVDEHQIGKRIKEAREERGMTQAKLAGMTRISTTQLSGYENGKVPSLTTLAKISRALGVSMDELYYGDGSESFINTAENEGELIVNCVAQLYSHRVIGEFVYLDQEKSSRYPDRPLYPYMLTVLRCQAAIRRLLANFDEVRDNIDTYENPAEQLRQIRRSVAKEITR